MKGILSSAILLFLLLAGQELAAVHFARWSTSMGSFTAEIYEQQTPITGNNFIDLANSGFYNNLIFHRVVAGFVIQDGCPYGTGYGGPGYTIPLEIYPGFHHDQPGILAMARSSAPNSAGSQYYITLAPAPHLDGNYAIFGKVVQGLDTVMAIGSVPVDDDDRPLTPVTIDTLRILDLSIGNVTPPDSLTYYCNINELQMFIVEASSQQFAIDYDWSVDGTPSPGMDFIFETTFQQPGTHTVVCSVSNQEHSHDVVWDVFAAGTAVIEEAPDTVAVMEIMPNPLRDGARINLHSTDADRFLISIYDLRGRLVRSKPEPVSGKGYWYWDGTNDLGGRVPNGVYIIQASSSRRSLSKRCVIY